MRRQFVRTLAEIAAQDARVMLLTGDMGYTVVEPFAERFPDRFVNVGVAEQNMVGIATGLAEAGLIPFVYSIATFAVLRPFEFIRNGPILHRLRVRVVGIGGGVEYGSAGPTHHALEDVAVLRSQPGITLITPADYRQAAEALRQTWDLPGPLYFRLGRDETSVVPGLDGRFSLDDARGHIRAGKDVVLVALGPAAKIAAAAADGLQEDGIDAGVIAISVVAPSAEAHLARTLGQYPAVVTIEAHGAVGGLGSLVAEVIARHDLRCTLRTCAIGAPLRESGSEAYLLDRHDVSPSAVRRLARVAIAGSGSR